MADSPRFAHCGFGSVVRCDAILAIMHPQSSCAKRHVKRSKDQGTFIDLCLGHTMRSVLVAENGIIIGCGIKPRTLQMRFNGVDEAVIDDPTGEVPDIELLIEREGEDDDDGEP